MQPRQPTHWRFSCASPGGPRERGPTERTRPAERTPRTRRPGHRHGDSGVSGPLRIERIRVTDFRGVREREVRFAEAGVTVVEGPNETGKSSLADALDMLLDFRDASRHRDVLAAQPVGTDAGPMVEADLRAGPWRFTYRKRWIRDRATTLVVREPRAEQHVGDAAHDRVHAILAEQADLGLWRALRLMQGEKVAPAHVEAAGSLGAALERAAGGSDPSDGAGLFERARAESEIYWTATGRARDPLTAGETAVAAAERTVADLRSSIAAVDADADALARASAELAGMREAIAAQEAAVHEREARAAEVDRLAAAAQVHKAAFDAATARSAEVAAIARRREELTTALADATQRRDALSVADAAARDRMVELDAALGSASRALADARGARLSAAALVTRRRAERDLLRDRGDLGSALEQKARLDRQAEEGRAAQAAADANPVTDEVLRRVEDAARRLELARARLDAGAGELRIAAIAPVTPVVDGAPVHLAPGEEAVRPIGEGIAVEIPGVARIVARPGGSVAALRAEIADADSALATGLAAAGSVDVAEARARAADRLRNEEAARRAREAATAILAGERPLALEQRIATLRARVEEAESSLGGDGAVPGLGVPGLAAQADTVRAAADLEAAETADRAAAADLAVAEEAERAARAAADAERAAGQERRVELGVAAARAREAEAALAAERATLPDDQLALRSASAEAEVRDAAAARAAADVALAEANPDQARALAENARRTLETIHARRQQLVVDQARLSGSLARSGEDGLGERLEEAEAAAERARDDLARLRRRADAARLLHDTLRRHRDAARRRYVLPLTERLESLGRIVFGPDVAVDVSDELAVSSLTRGGRTIAWDQLSVGTREQLGVLVRVACAEIVAPDGGVPVMLDDALGWSDPERLEAMGAVLARAGASTQVIVLTCFPDRYVHVGGATVVRLG